MAVPILQILVWLGGRSVWVRRLFWYFTLWTFQSMASELIAAFIREAESPSQDKKIYKDTMNDLKTTVSPLRILFLELLKAAIKEAAWRAFLNFADSIRNTDDDLQDVAEDVVNIG